ncbi:MAG: nitronate monooxygenase [Deltaproteobacteria bacterium]|nr:nitronate monooxygenase [Deltaproteobacteria bacterium]
MPKKEKGTIKVSNINDEKSHKHPFHTKLCDLLNIEYPIIQGALGGGVSGADLTAAVSNAGGLGVLAAWGLSMDKLRVAIRQTRDLTSKPFALNIMPVNRPFTQSRTELAIEEGIEIVTTGRGDPRAPIIKLLKSHGIKVLGVVPTVRHALRLEAEGVDALVASGCEAGGHVGKVSTMPLIPQVVDAVKIPVVAAGGIMDARGFLAALALGACGVQMGTRFMAAEESAALPEEKQRIVEAGEEDTVVTEIFTGKPVRVISSPRLNSLLKAMKDGLSPEETRARILELRKKKKTQEPGYNSVTSGQGAGLIHEILPAGEIVRQIITEAQTLYKRLDPWA